MLEVVSMVRPGWLAFAVAAAACAAPAEAGRQLHTGPTHVQLAGPPEWTEFAGRSPDADRFELRFADRANPAEQTLYVRQDNVKLAWRVMVNGKRVGELHKQEVPTVCALAVPAGTLVDGENTLSIQPPREVDHIVIAGVRLDPRPLAASVGEADLAVTVSDGDAGGSAHGLPSRITIVDARGFLPPVIAAPGQRLAVRPGVVYTPDGRARLALPAGDYTVYATRGPEYGLAERKIRLRAGDRAQVNLRIRREVATPGLIASDTHIHTLTFSGHGDSTPDERVLSLAGEGIELPIATEHNQHSGYQDAAVRMGVRGYFTPVLGNEVTTREAHFNVFPVVPGSPVPDARVLDWPALVAGIRATTGAQVVILNHPRNSHNGFIPFHPANFDRRSGDNLHGPPLTVDAIELVNSGSLRSDAMDIYRDWFALLNHGHKIYGVGSSDSHDVNRFIVGQARTLVAARDDAPDRIDVAQAAASFRAGRMLVSLGLVTQMWVGNVSGARFGVGDVATGLAADISVTVSVSGPSWAQVDRVALYANGVEIRAQRAAPGQRGGEKLRHTFNLRRPAHDAHLVAIATGPGVRAPYWAVPRPHQPSSPVWTPYVIGSTNPIWLDADGDGAFQAARDYAARLIERTGGDALRLQSALRDHDDVVAVQVASLLRAAGR